MKICKVCLKNKTLSEFYKHKYTLDGYVNNCKTCVKQYKHDYYKKHKNAKIEKRRIAYKEKHKLLKKSKKYKDVRNKSRKKRYKEDIIYRLSCILRSRLNIALKGRYKGIKSLSTIGCSLEVLKVYLENKFQNGMSWENHGKVWHIDHIKPISAFNLLDKKELVQANHHSNLQPLFAIDNLKKGAKYGTS